MVSARNVFCIVAAIFSFSLIASAANETTSAETSEPSSQPTTTAAKSTSPSIPTTTLTPAQECAKFSNTTCEKCVSAAGYKCVYCTNDKSCHLYPYKKVVPTQFCSLSNARWGVCWVNFEALIIAMSVVGGLILLVITVCCCYCCCCRGGNKNKFAKEDAKWERQKAERKQRGEDRKADRKQRMDEIRKKYGLIKDEPYQRFDA